MPLNEYPVWTAGVAVPPGVAGAPPRRADVVVVGGGIAGLAAARELARLGAGVVLCEARTLGWGASSRNGGQVLTGLKLGAQDLIRTYGRETARRMFAASLDALALVGQIVGEERIDCDFHRSGHLVVAAKPSHYAALAEEAELLEREFQHLTRAIPAASLGEEIGSRAYFGGLVDEASAAVHPARYVAGLAAAAARAGAQLFDRTPAESVRRAGGRIVVETPRGAVEADSVVVATGGYTGPATPALRRRLIPIGSYIIATEPLADGLAAELLPRGRMVYDTRHFLAYFRLTPDRRMLFGGRASFIPETPSTVRASAEILRRAMVAAFPQLAGAAVEHAWGGTVDFTFDMMPHSACEDGVHSAVGYAGHGVALATYLGTAVARRIAGGGEATPFDQPLPGAPLGLYDGRPWFLPFAGAWYKILDWLS